MNSTGSIQGPMMGFCEQGNDPSDSTNRDGWLQDFGPCELSEGKEECPKRKLISWKSMQEFTNPGRVGCRGD